MPREKILILELEGVVMPVPREKTQPHEIQVGAMPVPREKIQTPEHQGVVMPAKAGIQRRNPWLSLPKSLTPG